MTGDVYAASCDGGQTKALGHTRLNADQLAQVYDRVDRFQGFEYEQTDPPRPMR